MQRIDGRVVLSATDLNNHLACTQLTKLDLDALLHGLERPDADSRQAEILRALGEAHEKEYLERLRAERLDVVEIDRGRDLATACAATEAAMARGASVIYQAAFFDGRWVGHADFLRRVDRPLPGGRWAWHYEVEDTKLAREAQTYFVLQLCFYSEHVARIQGAPASQAYVVLGDGERKSFVVGEFMAYYRAVKERFLGALEAAMPAAYPIPVAHCSLCDWQPRCVARRIADDHLSLVARITRSQMERLSEGGIATLRALGESSSAPAGAKIAVETFEKLARQARLQLEQRNAIAAGEPAPYKYELLPVAAEEAAHRGFGLLPLPDAGDVFFDMEGDPYFEIGKGLEYLFGVFTSDDETYRAFWGCDRETAAPRDRLHEKHAFEQLVDFIVERRRTFPGMHVYHYAPYEKTALQRLAQRHGTREDEVDELLRDGVLVDLYRVVRQSVVVGQPSYSIKMLEAYYGQARDSSVKAGDESILRFEEWLVARHDSKRRDDAILEDLERYNRADCVSTRGLRDWLLRLRDRAMQRFGIEIPYHGAVPDERTPAKDEPYRELRERLNASLGADFDPDDERERYGDRWRRWLALQMLEYHYREDRPVWWQFHDRCATFLAEPAELLDDPETIVGLEPVSSGENGKGTRLRYPAQSHKLESGACFDCETKAGAGRFTILEETEEEGFLLLERGPRVGLRPLPKAITVRELAPPEPIRGAIARFAEALLGGGGRYRAAREIVARARPRLRRNGRGVSLFDCAGRCDPETVRRIVDALEESYLFVQGPPGSGKTYLGARFIVGLLEDGKRVGITANSHKAIHNMLAEVERVAVERGTTFAGWKKGSKDNDESAYTSTSGLVGNTSKFDPSAGTLFAGTAWAFAANEMDGALDYLFIDEAGQVALPNAIGAATAARNVVLLGDPLQLPQVAHTTHPGNVGASVLEHLLDEDLRPIAPDRGVFLSDTYRLHPKICAYVSEVMYEGRLHSAPGRERQRLDGPALSGNGLRYLPILHSHNRRSSIEEARAIGEEVEKLLRGSVTDAEGRTRALRSNDVMIVAAYNAQVRCIRKELERRGFGDVPVGTVDKFQGQEAYAVFYSAATSTQEDAPRGVGFIFDRNRVNVAISRARALAVLVANPELMLASCSTIEQIRAQSAVLRFVELASAEREAATPQLELSLR
ncbi:MAG: TM0106 family RecB-like putative nuclease [Candidatus Eremiobacteraeota bacterium]|nr:TM0106 family RecB-like putative nuclease [Candidatus Eremiobacteraeota bacterium]